MMCYQGLYIKFIFYTIYITKGASKTTDDVTQKIESKNGLMYYFISMFSWY